MVAFFVQHADLTQILLYASVVTALWLVENGAAVHPGRQKLDHTGLNMLFVLTALPIELALGMLCLGVSHWCAGEHWGLTALLPDNSWARDLVVFVALDLLDYVYHRIMHHVPLLWRFHLVHHTDRVVDSSTSVREHPGESIVRGGFLVLWTFVLGASFEVLLLRQAAETVFTILSHCALRLPIRTGRVLGLMFITPNLHHVHHHFELPFTDRNFGGVFSVWDRLFGTFAELAEAQTTFGLDTHMGVERGFSSLIAMPFATDDGGAGVRLPEGRPLALEAG